MIKGTGYAPVECVNIPKLLFKEKQYEKLSVDAKLLYSLLLDRKTVAMMNGWVDRYGTAYVIYPKSEMKKHLNASRYRVDMALNELEKCGQMVMVTQPNPGRPCQIYVKDITGNKMNEMEEDTMCMMKETKEKNEKQMIGPCHGIAVVVDEEEFYKVLEAMDGGKSVTDKQTKKEETEEECDKKMPMDFNSYKDEAYYSLPRKEQRIVDMEVRGYIDDEENLDEDAILGDACDLGEELGLNLGQYVKEGWIDHESLFTYLYDLHNNHKLNQLRAVLKAMSIMFGGSKEYVEDMESCIGYSKNIFLGCVLYTCEDVTIKMLKNKKQE